MEQFRTRSSAESSGRLGRAVSSAFQKLSPARMSRAGNRIDEDAAPEPDVKGPLGLNLLFDVAEPQIDFIFVHGLGGGSRKTWSISSDAQHYWPKEWLPKDPEFRHVRIHSFGYKADWGERGASLLNIRGFATSLIRDIDSNPQIRRSRTKIVLIAHSMGGIVVKKAFMLALEDSDMKELANRIHTLYFLATPHRGSDLAKTLGLMLKLSHSSKPYVGELERNSESIASINDSFRHVSKNLHLWSFYETLQSHIGGLQVLIVDPSSATLGYEKEKPVPMLADHRGISKFLDQDDSKYRTLRNHLVGTIDMISLEVSQESSRMSRLQHAKLVELTSVNEPPVDDLLALEDNRVSGSCQWLDNKRPYEMWKTHGTDQSIFWLTGKAGYGKSVLSSYVITESQNHNLKCSYFFFKNGVSKKSSIADCLQSLAYQMGAQDDGILEKLLEIHDTGEKWNENSIWRKLFIECIFKVSSTSQHFWVIDALDECRRFEAIMGLLSRTPRHLKIFLTSRQAQETERILRPISDLVMRYEIQPADTVGDFSIFIRSKIDRVPVGDEEDQVKLENRILAKASGSFLWVSLVLQRLEQAYSEEEVDEVLNEVPTNMNQLYAQVLGNMVKDPRASRLAKTIFIWTLLSFQPITINEMQSAIKSDVNQTVTTLEKTITTICGQLVSVNQKHEIETIHQTARTYLLQQELHPDLMINKPQSHTRIAQICLAALLAKFCSLPPLPGVKTRVSKIDQGIGLSNYASEYFSDHLRKCSSEDGAIWDLLCKFLRKGILPWIEDAAHNRNLSVLNRTAKNLHAYLKRRIKYLSPLDVDKGIVATWIIDLAKLNGKFGTNLVLSPTSIHTLVPALSPLETMIAKSISSRQGLLLKGRNDITWDDCLLRVDYPSHRTNSLAYGDRYSAVGLSNGEILLYCQDGTHAPFSLNHGERTKILAFSSGDIYLASSGLRTIKVWDPKEKLQLWAFDTQHQALDIHFLSASPYLVVATKGNYTITWSLDEGIETARWHWIESIKGTNGQLRPSQQPEKASFSSDSTFLAVNYRGLPIYLFDNRTEMFVGCCQREVSTPKTGTSKHYTLDALAFNPSPRINVLVASYGDGELTIYDVESTKLRYRRPDIYAHHLTASPDGRTLVTGSTRGTIQVFEFRGLEGDNLSLIYVINAYEDGIRGIAFSSDSLRFADIRGSQYRVWEPDLLVSTDLEEGSQSDRSQAITLEPKSVSMLEGPMESQITAILTHPAGDIVFAGKQDGTVTYFDTKAASEVDLLCRRTARCPIKILLFAEVAGMLIIADESGGVLVNRITISGANCEFGEQVVDIRVEDSITAILSNPSGTRILIHGRKSVMIYSMENEKVGHELSSRKEQVIIDGTLINHPLQPDQFISIGDGRIECYAWSNFEPMEMETSVGDGHLSSPFDHSWNLDQTNITSSNQNRPLLLITNLQKGNPSASLQIWQSSNLSRPIQISELALHASKITQIIAVADTTILFLDTALWVCSLDVSKYSSFAEGAKRHFFLLSEWKGFDGRFIIHYLPAKQEFVVVRKHGVLVVGRGLDFEEDWIAGV